MLELIQISIISIFAKLLKFLFEIGTNYFVSKEVYGHFAIMLSYILIAVKITSFGLPNIMIRELPKRNNMKYKSSLLFNSSFIVIIISFLIFIMIGFFNIKDLISYTEIYFIIPSMALLILYSTYLRSIGFVKTWIFLQDIMWYILYFTVLIILYFNNVLNINIETILQIYTFSIIFTLIIVLLILKYKYSMLLFCKISIKKIKYLVQHSSPVLFTGLTYLILSRVDVIMLSNYVDITLIGEYNIVARITMQVLFFNQVIVAYFYPRLAKKFASKISYENIAIYNTKFVILSFLSVIIASLTLLCMILYFNLFDLLKIIHKDALFNVFLIFAITQIIYSALSFYGHILLYIHRQKIEYINNIIILTIGIGLNYVLIPVYGVFGAALGSSIAILFGSILEMLQVKYYTNTFFINLRGLKK